MEIRTVSAEQYAQMLALIETGLRPAGGPTRARDDFPLILEPANRTWQFVALDGSAIVGCLACLIRPFVTSAGLVSIAGIGSVVTAPAYRGRGISGRLQHYALARIAAARAPLAVLWTDRPEFYQGRGFRAAGVEYHADIAGCALDDVAPSAGRIRRYTSADAAAVSALYDQHRLRTIRALGDAARLYGMRGTQGLVYDEGQHLRGYLFAGKGADFPDYVTEFGGDDAAVMALLAVARRRRIASKVLIPQGATTLRHALAARGAACFAQTSGMWHVVAADPLRTQLTKSAARVAPWPASDDPVVWIGGVGAEGEIRAGVLELAVWGFDSV